MWGRGRKRSAGERGVEERNSVRHGGGEGGEVTSGPALSSQCVCSRAWHMPDE